MGNVAISSHAGDPPALSAPQPSGMPTSYDGGGGGVSKAKALGPPSIANYDKHRSILRWLNELRTTESSPFRSGLARVLDSSTASSGMPEAEEFPARLQRYVMELSLRPSPEELALQSEAESLPRAGMLGAPDEANLLCLLLELIDARKVVEVGVFRGMTTLAFARCLQGLDARSGVKRHGSERRVIGLDVSNDFAQVGKKYWEQAGVEEYIDFRVGDAKDSLSQLLEDEGVGENSVDMCFIDADKDSYDDYYEKCLRLTRTGGLIVVDNTIWAGRVLIPDAALDVLAEGLSVGGGDLVDNVRMVQATRAIKALTRKISEDDRVERVCFLTIADGVIICRKK